MVNSYNNYINDFKKLDDEDKKSEIITNLDELLKIILKLNNEDDYILPTNDNFYDKTFIKIISIKEEIAKYVIRENGGN